MDDHRGAPATGDGASARGDLSVGRVVQVSISPGGVPKEPIVSARVGPLGLEGDRHDDRTAHGGPHRAVCLYTVEAIRRVRAEGHPIFPGSIGENLTLEGIELGDLSLGDRLAVGAQVVLEISGPCNPCETIRDSFDGGRIARVSVKVHPRDSRLYARVLSEGEVQPGDEVRVLAPLPDSLARTHALLDRLDSAERAAWQSGWRAAIEGGLDVHVIDDGDVAVAATPSLAEPDFNTALGLRQVPHCLPDVLDHFRRHRAVGWVALRETPWEGAVADRRERLLGAEPAVVDRAVEVAGLRIVEVGPRRAEEWTRLTVDGFGMQGALARAWLAAGPHQARDPEMHLLIAELDGTAVGAAGLFTHHDVGNLGPATVMSAARGRGIHAALIATRARLAWQLGCDLLGAQATVGSRSERNFVRMGFERVWERGLYRFDPGLAGE